MSSLQNINPRYLIGIIIGLLLIIIGVVVYFLFFHSDHKTGNMIYTETGVLGPDTNDPNVKKHIFSSDFEQSDGPKPPAMSEDKINSATYR
ncbi:MAG: hypothetical protein N3A71_01795 [Candidatus Dojkabacteria bacterium]|nr:hypothetical protein [Candidatus Dojkabacteria bacterium]